MGDTVKTGNFCSSIIAGGKLDFIGQVLCPMKGAFSDGYNKLLEKHLKNGGESIYSYVPTVCTGNDKVEKDAPSPGDILKYLTIDDFPDLAASFGFGDYFSSVFQERFLEKNYFSAPARSGLNSFFENTGIEDPLGEFYIYSGYPAVFMIDKKKLGNLPVPHTWKDLLNPIYKDNITIGGGHGVIGTTVPLYLYKNFGKKALDQFDYNVSQAMHPSEMSRVVGTSNPRNTAIYTTLYFFANAGGEKKNVEIVWPEDGAVIEPAFFLLKKGKEKKYKFIIDYITGKGFGTVAAKNGFPVASPDVDNHLPSAAKLQWIGWDFIRSHKMENVLNMISSVFQKYMNVSLFKANFVPAK